MNATWSGNEMAWLLFWLLVAHHVFDIALQSCWMAEMKAKRWYIMLSHCIIWTGGCCLPLAVFGVLAWWKPVVLFVGHIAIDSWKAGQPRDDEHWPLIYVDQALHLGQLLYVALWA